MEIKPFQGATVKERQMTQYVIDDSGKEVSARKLPPPPKGWQKFEKELSKAIWSLLKIAFWIAGGIAICDILFH